MLSLVAEYALILSQLVVLGINLWLPCTFKAPRCPWLSTHMTPIFLSRMKRTLSGPFVKSDCYTADSDIKVLVSGIGRSVDS